MNRTLGHAGAIWELESETAASKRALWREAGIEVVATPADIGPVMKVRSPRSVLAKGTRADAAWFRLCCRVIDTTTRRQLSRFYCEGRHSEMRVAWAIAEVGIALKIAFRVIEHVRLLGANTQGGKATICTL